MSLLSILRLGHPVLRSPSAAIEPEDIREPHTQALIDDLIDTMRESGGVGLAAPQVGILLQLFVYLEIEPNRGEPDQGEPASETVRVLINPLLEPRPGELVYDWEGCLSIPDLRGLVPRHPAVRVYGFDRDGEKVDFLAEGYTGRIIQHEFDHLNGVVFVDRMRDLHSLAFGAEWEEFMVSPGGD